MAQRHMDRLTSFDTSFLVNEKSNGHMAIGAILVCEGSPPSHEDFLSHVRSRLHLLPRLRQRLAVPPLQMGRPFWTDDPDFDIDAHIRRVSLPAPGSEEQFHELIDRTLAPPLDRSRSLWELLLVEGFEDDRFGVVYRTHHALADGISAVDIGTLLFDVEPKFEPVREEVSWNPQRPPSKPGLVGHAISGLGTTAVRLARWVLNALRRPKRATKRAADGAAGLWEVTWALTKPSPKVPVNAEISPNRSYRWTRCSLDDFKRIKNALGGTVNDVSLAVTSGALRRWLEDRGLQTDGLQLQALVPVSVRMENEHGELGNRLTAMRGPLPVGIADPVERLRFVSASMDALKSSKQPLGAEAIWGLNDWFRDFGPPWLLNLTSKVNFATRLFNLLVTNFPGPQIPIYILGRELVGVYPVGFLAKGHALSIAIISYNGAVNFGLLSDPDSIEDVEQITRYVTEEVEELLDAAGTAGAGGRPASLVG